MAFFPPPLQYPLMISGLQQIDSWENSISIQPKHASFFFFFLFAALMSHLKQRKPKQGGLKRSKCLGRTETVAVLSCSDVGPKHLNGLFFFWTGFSPGKWIGTMEKWLSIHILTHVSLFHFSLKIANRWHRRQYVKMLVSDSAALRILCIQREVVRLAWRVPRTRSQTSPGFAKTLSLSTWTVATKSFYLAFPKSS